MSKKTKNIRVLEESYVRLKVKAAKKGKNLMEHVDDLSKLPVSQEKQ